MKKRGTGALAPGGKLLVGGIAALIVLFLAWQFVITPIFITRNDSTTEPGKSGEVQTKNSNNPTAAKPELTGQILDATSGRPIPAATIKKSDGSELVKADTDGNFAIPKLPADKTKLTVVAPGYTSVALPTTADAAKAIQLQPLVLTGQLVDSESQKPIANRRVSIPGDSVVTDDNGKFSFSRVTDQTKISVDLIGYEKVEQNVDLNKLDNMVVAVRSTTFSGSLTDAGTSKPIANAVVKSDDGQMAISGEDGKFSFNDLKRDETTTLKVRAPGYRLQSFKASELAKGVKIEPFYPRAVYVPGVFAIEPNYDDLFTPYLKMAEQGQINAIVLGIKDDDTGELWYDSQVPLAQQLNLVYHRNNITKKQLMNIPKILAEAKKRNIYVIGRFVVMRDPGLAAAKPEWAIKNKAGQPWKDDNGLSWPNPFVPEVADYNAALAKELSQLGFDEVQYDYIRFPTDGKLKEIQYKPDLSWTQLSDNEKLRTDTIEAVVKKAYDVLRPSDTFLSLDVFGMSLWREDDNNIGQQYNDLVMMSDYICPMVYPTHFETGTLDQKQYPGPTALYPGVIIDKSGVIANKLEAKLKPVAKYRPWLEDFSLGSVKHTPERVRLQIDAANKQGAWGWTLWNAAGKYSTGILTATASAKPTRN